MKLGYCAAILAVVSIVSLQACAPVVVGAGVGAGVMMAEDRRTNVISFNRVVLLVGQLPSEAIKDEIGLLALGTENVRTVQNEIAIAGTSSFVSRSSDALLTSKVKSRLLNNDEVGANHVKVVTNNDTVYLMGLVTRAEADAATQTAATTSGVQRVVKVFEYLD